MEKNSSQNPVVNQINKKSATTAHPKTLESDSKRQNLLNKACQLKMEVVSDSIKMQSSRPSSLVKADPKWTKDHSEAQPQKNQLTLKIPDHKGNDARLQKKNLDLNAPKSKPQKESRLNHTARKPKQSDLKILVYYYYISFGSTKKKPNFVLSQLEFEIFKCILKTSKSYTDEHFDQIMHIYAKNKIIESIILPTQPEEPRSTDRPLREPRRVYSIPSKNLELIQKDFLNGTMPLHLSSSCILKIFQQVLGCNQSEFQQLHRALRVDQPTRERLLQQIQVTLEQSQAYLRSTHQVEIKKKLNLELELLEKASQCSDKLKYLVALDTLVRNREFMNVFVEFVNMLRLPKLVKKNMVYHVLGCNIKSQVDQLLKITSSLGGIEELSERDLQANLLGLFDCGFLKEILSFVQVQESAEVIFEKWFN